MVPAAGFVTRGQSRDSILAEQFNGQDLQPKPSAVRVDASNTGYGGYMVEHGGQIANGMWSEEEAAQSSTWRELRAVQQVLESFVHDLQNERVLITKM